jgi:hypothetical protein
VKKLKGVDGKLDLAWSELVKLRAGWKCEYCGKSKYLQSHHIFSRSKKSTRWDVQNGIALCVGHHTFSSTFSAHKTPLEFIDWLYNYRGTENINLLRIRANMTSKLHDFEKQILLIDLKDRITKIKKDESN